MKSRFGAGALSTVTLQAPTWEIRLISRITFTAITLGLAMLTLVNATTPLCAQAWQPGLGPGDHRLRLDVGELRREYLVHVPSGYDRRREVPVLLMFHGFGGSLDETALATEWRSKADAETFLAVFPNGFPNSEGIRFWADGRALSEAQDDVAFTRAILDDLARRFRVDRKHIFAVGFSNGAGMAFRLAVQLGDRIAAIAPVAGRPHSIQPGGLRRPVPMVFAIGTEDR